ncbi:hypothetical protein JHK87_039112 [Glycine soja]|nr:hypothetical protein JHK87_039112 [Glycine soja]
MTQTTSEVAHDFPGLIRVFTDGRIQRFTGTDFVSPSTTPHVTSKDITLHPHSTTLSERLFLPTPQTAAATRRNNPPRALLIYFHGGAFCASSPFTANNHNYVATIRRSQSRRRFRRLPASPGAPYSGGVRGFMGCTTATRIRTLKWKSSEWFLSTRISGARLEEAVVDRLWWFVSPMNRVNPVVEGGFTIML